MKIDESCINHNAARIIDWVLGDLHDFSHGEEYDDHTRLQTLGYIRGVIDFAKELKKVLKE